MKSLTSYAHELVQNVLQPGDIAIDATAGNGHDTLFLAQQVGVNGKVFAFDIQPQAISKTRDLVDQSGCKNVVLVNESHAEMQRFIPNESHGKIAAVMFNLGYLPGGDKFVITQTNATIVAIKSSYQLLRNEGILTVLAYVGHPGGDDEAKAVRCYLQQYSSFEDLSRTDCENAPKLYVVRKTP